MDENQVIQYVNAIANALNELDRHIKAVEEKVDEGIAEADKRINELHNVVYDEIINPANEYIGKMDREARFDDFNEKYGERLGSLNDELSAIEGDDYDIVRDAFDQYDSYEGDKPDEDEFVDSLVEAVGNQLSQIKEKLGIAPNADIEVKQDEEGNTVVESEGEVVATDDGDGEEDKGEDEDVTTVEVEEPAKEEGEEKEAEGEEEKEEAGSDEDELKAFEKELENYKK